MERSDFVLKNGRKTYIVVHNMSYGHYWKGAMNVKEIRIRVGMTQLDLAERLGCAQSEVSRIESGERSVTVDRLFDLARVLGVSPAELLGDSERKAA